MQSQARQKLADSFIAALGEDVIPWRKCWSGARPINLHTGKEYRGVNNLFLSYASEEKGYRDPRWMTYKQAMDRGCQVRKGEKSERVEFWHYYDTASKRVLDADEVKQIRAEDPDCMRRLRLAAYTYCVFNAEQVEGVEPQQPARCADVEQLARSRDLFLANLGVEFREGGDRACYRPGTDSIVMPYPACFTSDYAYVCTLLHEAGHATGHYSRLDRPMSLAFGTPEYAKEELRAEIASAFTSQALGLTLDEGELGESLERNKAYIQSWIGVLKENPNELFAAIRDADRIADYLVERGQVLTLGIEAGQGLAEDQSPRLQPERGVELEL